MVRREISSTLGRKRASWELEEERERRWSQGESWRDWLKKKDSLELKAMPKVKPSDLWILASAQGWYTLLVLVAITTATTSGSSINHNAPFAAIVVFGFDDDDDDGVVGVTSVCFFLSPQLWIYRLLMGCGWFLSYSVKLQTLESYKKKKVIRVLWGWQIW